MRRPYHIQYFGAASYVFSSPSGSSNRTRARGMAAAKDARRPFGNSSRSRRVEVMRAAHLRRQDCRWRIIRPLSDIWDRRWRDVARQDEQPPSMPSAWGITALPACTLAGRYARAVSRSARRSLRNLLLQHVGVLRHWPGCHPWIVQCDTSLPVVKCAGEIRCSTPWANEVWAAANQRCACAGIWRSGHSAGDFNAKNIIALPTDEREWLLRCCRCATTNTGNLRPGSLVDCLRARAKEP